MTVRVASAGRGAWIVATAAITAFSCGAQQNGVGFEGPSFHNMSFIDQTARTATLLKIRLHTADAHSPAFRDPLAAMFFIEERNRDAAELWLHFEEELGREPLADEPLAALNAALAAFEELAEAQRRADRVAVGFAESEIGQARRRRAAEAAAQWEQAVAQFNARRERRGA